MKTKTIIKLLLWYLIETIVPQQSHAQGEFNNMIMGESIGYNFGSSTPQYFNNNLFPMIGASAAISDASGQLLFYTNGFWIWNRNHHIFPELTNGISGYNFPLAQSIGYPPLMPFTGSHTQQATTIAKVPRSTNLYYVFSLSSNGVIYYSLIDINLNNGLGGIVAGKKGIYLSHGYTEKMNVVAGCDNIWLVSRSLQQNAYSAFEIRDTGIIHSPVVSTVGQLPLTWYRTGSIRFNADGSKMAAACGLGLQQSSGVELYDFDKINGIISNAQILDSSSTQRRYFGVCFSEDGTKLYASESSFYLNSTYGTFFNGKVRQFDLSLPTINATIASNTILYTEPSLLPDRVGDLQRAADGKIYFSSAYSNIPIHVINNPNLAGLAANVSIAQLPYPSSSLRRAMPNNIAIAPIPDTISNNTNVVGCFLDSLVLEADIGRHHLWSNGSTASSIKVNQSGTYTVQFMNQNCVFQIDTFKVKFYTLPILSSNSYSCPGANKGKAKLLSSENFNYEWYKTNNGNDVLIHQYSGSNGSELRNIDTGEYKVHISTIDGCDSFITFRIEALPVPLAHIMGDTILCAKTESVFSYNGDAPQHDWLFSNGAVSYTKEVNTIFYDTGYANARLIVSNAEGCSDTAILPLKVKGLDLKLSASKQIVSKGNNIRLQSWAPENYEVLQWQPIVIFGNSDAKTQQMVMDSSTTFYVTAISNNGCEATASVVVEVLTDIRLPNAFTPNGDGKNDRFAPLFRGNALIRKFEVYNRWGQAVYSAWGTAAIEGWDGSLNGKPCDIGTYFYYINVEVQQGKTIEQKGDVLLMR